MVRCGCVIGSHERMQLDTDDERDNAKAQDKGILGPWTTTLKEAIQLEETSDLDWSMRRNNLVLKPPILSTTGCVSFVYPDTTYKRPRKM